jgi:hypothetical protein
MTNCTQCGTELKLILAGVSKKTGKPYNSFMACPNKCKIPFTESKPKPSPKPQNESTSDLDLKGVNMIMEEFANLNKRFDDLGKFLVKKLGTDGVDVKNLDF